MIQAISCGDDPDCHHRSTEQGEMIVSYEIIWASPREASMASFNVNHLRAKNTLAVVAMAAVEHVVDIDSNATMAEVTIRVTRATPQPER